MAKKKRKKRRPDRPRPTGTSPTTEAARPRTEGAATRQERKEVARRERERRVRQARRRQRLRRATRWGATLAVVGGIGVFVWFQVQQGREIQKRAEEAAARIGCGDIQTTPNLVAGLTQQEIHSPPFAQGQGGVPATNGRHSSPLPPEPHVYDQPIAEANAVHNLEHGYVIIYYAGGGENALSPDTVGALEDLAKGETKVLMAPYPDLAKPFDLVAWRELQTCDPAADADPDDAVAVARGFIDEFRSGGLAPEPGGV